MKRQLIAALLALNVAAVAVPSATFTVSAAEEVGIEAQAAADVEAAKETAANSIKGLVPDVTVYAENQKKIVKGIVDAYVAKVDAISGADITELKDNLDDLVAAAKKEIDVVPTSTQVTTAKDTDLVNAYNTAKSGDYTDEKKADIDSLKAEAEKAIVNAATVEGLNGLVTGFNDKVKTLQTKTAYVEALQKEIDAWLPDGVKSADEYGYYVNADGTTTNSRQLFDDKKAACKALVATKTSEADMQAAFKAYQTDVKNNVLTKAQGEAEANLVKIRKEKVDQLKAYFPAGKSQTSYTGNQFLSITTYKSEGEKAINLAKSQADIDKAYADAVAKIDAVKTKADVEKSVAEVIAEIKALGEVNITNYNNKYEALAAAEDSYEAVETGAVGQQKIDTETNNALTTARSNYNNFKKQELNAELDKIDTDIVNLTRKNYLASDIKTRLDNIEKAAKTIKNDTTITDRIGDGTAADTTRKDYNDAITTIASQIATELGTLISDLDVSNPKFAINDKNKLSVEQAIATYDELVALDPNNAALSTHRKAYRTLKDLIAAQDAAKGEFNLAEATISAIPDQVYTGKDIKPEVTVTSKNGTVIDAKNYDVTYVGHTNVGVATLKVTAKGDSYTGSKETTFNIVARNISDAKVVAADMYYYKGAARNASASITVAGRNLAKGTDYTVAYSNNKNIGTATMTITGKDNYTGTVKATYVIKPAKSAVKSLKAGKKKLTVKTEKQPGAKYQIAYKVKGGSYKTVKTSNVSKTIKSLKSGKTYAVKVRAYKSIGGKTYYGRYSAVKTVKVK